MKQKNVILMVIAVGCGLGAAVLTARMNSTPKIEMVKVAVAGKDLTTGTMVTKDNVAKLFKLDDRPKTGLPKEFLVSLDDLVGKRLVRALRADDVVNPADVRAGSAVIFEENKHIMSLPMTAPKAAGGYVGPGSRVDVLASLNDGDSHKVFTLLTDMHVLAVNGQQDLNKQDRFHDMNMVSFAVDQDQALLIALAKQRNCSLELLLRHPNIPVNPNYDIAKVRKILEDSKKKQEFVGSEKGGDDKGVAQKSDVVPTEVKVPMVRVYYAKENIDPNTEITPELLAQFEQRDMPQGEAEALGVCTNLAQHFGSFKVLKYGVAKGLPIVNAAIGPQPLKATAPPEEFSLPKPGPKTDDGTGTTVVERTEVAPMPREVKPPAPRTKEVALHTTNGTIIHRYIEIRPFSEEWKLVATVKPGGAPALATELVPPPPMPTPSGPGGSTPPTGPNANPPVSPNID
jgi:Flp pilus assembly protein CpaB